MYKSSKCDIIKYVTPCLYHSFWWNGWCDIIKVRLYWDEGRIWWKVGWHCNGKGFWNNLTLQDNTISFKTPWTIFTKNDNTSHMMMECLPTSLMKMMINGKKFIEDSLLYVGVAENLVSYVGIFICLCIHMYNFHVNI